MGIIIIIRHGFSESNKKGYLTHDIDGYPLTVEGETLHGNGYIHGDLLGGNNIMLTKEGKIKLIDSLYIPKDFKYKDVFINLDNKAVKSVINFMYFVWESWKAYS